jgi:predicted permease
MRDLKLFFIIAGAIAAGLYGLVRVGITYETDLHCTNCNTDLPLSNFTDYLEKALYIFTYFPLLIFNKLNLTLTQNQDINYALTLTISFFLFFLAIAFTYWLLRRLLMLIFKEDPTERDTG